MQDIDSIDGEIRRLRPHHHHHPAINQALKCPRCDSSNTKFCYYNNYNLSQPRHFCKGCRRYWTKGGVLRNVPVGGGCRKTKRSNPKSSQSVATPPPKSSSNSSSESSTLTAAATEAVSASSSRSPPEFLNIEELMNPGQGFDILEESANCGFFSGIGSFSSLITSSNDQLSFRFDSALDPHTQWEPPAPVAAGSGAVELKPQPGAESPLFLSSCTSILRPSSDQGLFDLPNAVDDDYNWTQTNPWSDMDQPTYIP